MSLLEKRLMQLRTLPFLTNLRESLTFMEKKANFIDEIAGLKPSNVLMILDEQGKKSYRAQKVVVNNEHADINPPK